MVTAEGRRAAEVRAARDRLAREDAVLGTTMRDARADEARRPAEGAIERFGPHRRPHAGLGVALLLAWQLLRNFGV